MVDFGRLQEEPGSPLIQYAERVQAALDAPTRSGFDPDACNVMMAHLLADDAMVGPGGGERELHMAMGIYGVAAAALPVAAQYVALGHVHKPQEIACATKAAYSRLAAAARLRGARAGRRASTSSRFTRASLPRITTSADHGRPQAPRHRLARAWRHPG